MMRAIGVFEEQRSALEGVQINLAIGGDHVRAGPSRPDRGQMALSRTLRPYQRQSSTVPVWPGVDRFDGLGVGRRDNEILTSKRLGTVKIQSELTAQ